MIKFDVLEEDTFSDDPVGCIELPIEDILPPAGQLKIVKELDLKYEEEEAGTLKIEVEFTPAP